MDSIRILLLDPAPVRDWSRDLRHALVDSLRSSVVDVKPCARPPSDPSHWEEIARSKSQVVFFTAAEHTIETWLASLHHRRQLADSPPLIAVLNDTLPQTTAALLHAGVADFLVPPLSRADVMPRVLRLLPRSRLRPPASSPPLAASKSAFARLVGNSSEFITQLNKLPQTARCDASVLIDGETGTGKEVFARAVHEVSARAARPFVPVNCGSIPVELIESELFGHERGAFTGAIASQKGLIAQAEGGTLFLDEIAALPLLAQAKLLRFLQEKEYRPLGAGGLRTADVRVIAAANLSLEQAVARGAFRQDLYYRLNVIRITLPPLRRRRDDIPHLARHFLAQFAQRFGRSTRDFAPDAIAKLVAHDWPGNVRELEHVIERTVVFATGNIIRADDIDLPERNSARSDEPFRAAKARTIAQFERHYIERLLTAHGGNISSAARRAGKNRRAFWELIRKHRIQVERFRRTDAEPPTSPPASDART